MGMLSGMQKNDLKMEKCVVSKPYNPEEKCSSWWRILSCFAKSGRFRIMHCTEGRYINIGPSLYDDREDQTLHVYGLQIV